jgi:hypothetical protein
MALLLTAPSTGFAQSGDGDGDGDSNSGSSDGNINPRIVSINGVSQDTLGDIFINLENCVDKVDMQLEVDGLPGDKDVLDIYVGTGTNCTSTEARDGDGEADCRKLDDPYNIEGLTQDVPITLQVTDIIRAAFNNSEDCSERSSKPTLWFLAVDNSGGTDAVTANQYGTIELNIDTDPPDAPTGVKGGRGENEIPVSWSVGSNKVDSFEIYVDSGNGMAPMRDGSVEPTPEPTDEDGGSDDEAAVGETNDMCGTGALRSGASADDVPSLRKKPVGSATATETTLSSSLIEGDAAAVAVVALDAAGNRSGLSEVACVFVVPTRGIKDLYEEKYGEMPQGCPCSAAGPAQVEGALPIGLALAFIAFRRRRRS